MKEFMEEVKPFVYFARWTNDALELVLLLTQAFRIDEIDSAIEDYFQNTYIPALQTEGRMRYELEKASHSILSNLKALKTILEIDHSEVDYIIEDIFVGYTTAFLEVVNVPVHVHSENEKFPNVEISARLPDAKRAIEEKIFNLVKFIQTQDFSKYLHHKLEGFCTRQEMRWRKEKTNG